MWREWSDPALPHKGTTEASFKNKDLGMGILTLLLQWEVLETLRCEASQQQGALWLSVPDLAAQEKAQEVHCAADQVIPATKENSHKQQHRAAPPGPGQTHPLLA